MSLKRIISLTSIPPRFGKLPITLKSLLSQQTDSVRLYVPRYYRRFPDWDGTLPDVPQGVTVVRCETDYGPATKVLAACDEFAGQDAQILFCDDDCVVAPDWAERLFSEQARRSGEAVATWVRTAEGYVDNPVKTIGGRRAVLVGPDRDIPYRASRLLNRLFRLPVAWQHPVVCAGYGDVLFGAAGAVIRPEFFDSIARDVAPEAWMVDDIWLSACLARRAVPIYAPSFVPLPRATESSTVDALLHTEFDGLSRYPLNRRAAQTCQQLLGVWQAV